MNSYSVDLSNGFSGYDKTLPVTKTLLKILGYATLFGKNQNLVPRFFKNDANALAVMDSENDNGFAPVFCFDLDFSLSNLVTWNTPPAGTSALIFQQCAYDTQCQGVKEFVDKPYPVKGYLAIAINTTGDATKDMDNFVKIPFFEKAGVTEYIYIGLLNSSKTDFYTPLDGCVSVIMDVSQFGKK